MTAGIRRPRSKEMLVSHLTRTLRSTLADEDGSLVAEYGLLAVVSATACGVLITYATGGALRQFFSALLSHARGLVIQ